MPVPVLRRARVQTQLRARARARMPVRVRVVKAVRVPVAEVSAVVVPTSLSKILSLIEPGAKENDYAVEGRGCGGGVKWLVRWWVGSVVPPSAESRRHPRLRNPSGLP